MSDHDLAQCKSNFIALSKATAQRTLRFWAVLYPSNNSGFRDNLIAGSPVAKPHQCLLKIEKRSAEPSGILR
jgi:hypothetical protein